MPHGKAFHSFKRRSDFLVKSVARGLAIFTRFAGADVNALAIVHLYFDSLVATVATNVKTHIVASFFQLANDFVRNSALDFNITAVRHFLASWLVIPLVLPALSVTRFLHVHAKIDLVRQ